MRLRHLALIFVLSAPSLLGPSAALAQGSSQQMLNLAKQLRAQAEQMKDSLPPEDIASLISQAEEIEQGVRDGGYSTPVAAEPVSVSKRIADAHQGRLDWLDGEAACVGYGWENHRTFKSNYGDAKRDELCRAAFARYEEYFRKARNGAGSAATDPLLEAYDRAAQAAVDYYAGK